MDNQIVAQANKIAKIRPNLWQAPDGAVIGYGALLAPAGFYFCFTCSTDECRHVQAIDEAWLAGDAECSAERIPFDGSVPEDEPLDFDGDELIFASGIEWPDEYGLSEPAL